MANKPTASQIDIAWDKQSEGIGRVVIEGWADYRLSTERLHNICKLLFAAGYEQGWLDKHDAM